MTYYAWRITLGIMIRSFGNGDTERLFNDEAVPRFRAIERAARRRLLFLHRARLLQDLRVPPGNQLEALKGDRKGQHSIRINDQWRICFRWTRTDPMTSKSSTTTRRPAPKLLEPIPPGEILLEDFMRPMGISINALARAIAVPPAASARS